MAQGGGQCPERVELLLTKMERRAGVQEGSSAHLLVQKWRLKETNYPGSRRRLARLGFLASLRFHGWAGSFTEHVV